MHVRGSNQLDSQTSLTGRVPSAVCFACSGHLCLRVISPRGASLVGGEIAHDTDNSLCIRVGLRIRLAHHLLRRLAQSRLISEPRSILFIYAEIEIRSENQFLASVTVCRWEGVVHGTSGFPAKISKASNISCVIVFW